MASTATTTTPSSTKGETEVSTKRARTEGESYPLNPEFLKYLCSVKAETLYPPSGIVFIAKRDDTVVEVWKGLLKHGFSSVPVLQKTKNKYYGFVDMADILTAVVGIFGKAKLETDEDFWEIKAKDEIFSKKLIKEIMHYPISSRNPFHPVHRGFSLFSVMEALAKLPGLERVPIIDEGRNLVNVVTQSQIVSFLQKNINRMGKAKDRPISQFHSLHRDVPRINEDDPAIEAFKMMHNLNISGLAVVDKNDHLVGAISLRDLKLISTDGKLFWRLYQPIVGFLRKHEKEGTQRPSHPIVVEQADTIESVIEKFDTHKIHRLFLVDTNKKPIGYVTLKDILFEVISE